MREYKVWNLEQTEGVKLPKKTRALIDKLDEVKNRVPDPVAEAQRLGEMLKNADIAPVTHDGGGMAFYRPATHSIHIPHKGAFANELDMYEVIAHETIHATGAKHLLNRPTLVNSVRMGSPEYALEELTAVMGALFLLQEADASITPDREKNWSSYLKSFDMRKVLKENPQIFIRSLVHAEFASQFVAHPELRPEFMKGRKAPDQTEIEFEDYALTREKIGNTPEATLPESQTPLADVPNEAGFTEDALTVRDKMISDLACIGESFGGSRNQPENEIA
jgi:antirestriction protein ArdC